MNKITDIQLLQQNQVAMDSAIYWLKRSYSLCQAIGIKADYSEEEYDCFETLTSRYARAIDLIVRKVLRSIDGVEFERTGTLIDSINRAEKRGLIDNIYCLRQMTDLRNEIAHDYIKAELIETFSETLNKTAEVITFSEKINHYITQQNY